MVDGGQTSAGIDSVADVAGEESTVESKSELAREERTSMEGPARKTESNSDASTKISVQIEAAAVVEETTVSTLAPKENESAEEVEKEEPSPRNSPGEAGKANVKVDPEPQEVEKGEPNTSNSPNATDKESVATLAEKVDEKPQQVEKEESSPSDSQDVLEDGTVSNPASKEDEKIKEVESDESNSTNSSDATGEVSKSTPTEKADDKPQEVEEEESNPSGSSHVVEEGTVPNPASKEDENGKEVECEESKSRNNEDAAGEGIVSTSGEKVNRETQEVEKEESKSSDSRDVVEEETVSNRTESKVVENSDAKPNNFPVKPVKEEEITAKATESVKDEAVKVEANSPSDPDEASAKPMDYKVSAGESTTKIQEESTVEPPEVVGSKVAPTPDCSSEDEVKPVDNLEGLPLSQEEAEEDDNNTTQAGHSLDIVGDLGVESDSSENGLKPDVEIGLRQDNVVAARKLDESQAATKIQAIHRGKSTRMALMHMQQEQKQIHAAIKQTSFPGATITPSSGEEEESERREEVNDGEDDDAPSRVSSCNSNDMILNTGGESNTIEHLLDATSTSPVGENTEQSPVSVSRRKTNPTTPGVLVVKKQTVTPQPPKPSPSVEITPQSSSPSPRGETTAKSSMGNETVSKLLDIMGMSDLCTHLQPGSEIDDDQLLELVKEKRRATVLSAASRNNKSEVPSMTIDSSGKLSRRNTHHCIAQVIVGGRLFCFDKNLFMDYPKSVLFKQLLSKKARVGKTLFFDDACPYGFALLLDFVRNPSLSVTKLLEGQCVDLQVSFENSVNCFGMKDYVLPNGLHIMTETSLKVPTPAPTPAPTPESPKKVQKSQPPQATCSEFEETLFRGADPLVFQLRQNESIKVEAVRGYGKLVMDCWGGDKEIVNGAVVYDNAECLAEEDRWVEFSKKPYPGAALYRFSMAENVTNDLMQRNASKPFISVKFKLICSLGNAKKSPSGTVGVEFSKELLRWLHRNEPGKNKVLKPLRVTKKKKKKSVRTDPDPYVKIDDPFLREYLGAPVQQQQNPYVTQQEPYMQQQVPADQQIPPNLEQPPPMQYTAHPGMQYPVQMQYSGQLSPTLQQVQSQPSLGYSYVPHQQHHPGHLNGHQQPSHMNPQNQAKYYY